MKQPHHPFMRGIPDVGRVRHPVSQWRLRREVVALDHPAQARVGDPGLQGAPHDLGQPRDHALRQRVPGVRLEPARVAMLLVVRMRQQVQVLVDEGLEQPPQELLILPALGQAEQLHPDLLCPWIRAAFPRHVLSQHLLDDVRVADQLVDHVVDDLGLGVRRLVCPAEAR